MHNTDFRSRTYKYVGFLGLGLALGTISVTPGPTRAQGPGASASQAVVLILDASGSMWEQLDGGYKIQIAQGALKNITADLSDETQIGLIAYGHRRRQDCSDIQTLVPLGRIDRASLNREIDALNPVGRTPITASIREAINVLAGHDGPASVILVSDGLETCGGDPCQLVRDTRASGVNIVMHVVGFGVGEVDTSQLECTAQAGGGRYISAADADELAAALRTTVEAPPFTGGWLSIGATRDGELMDVAIYVTPAGGGGRVGGGRTYRSPTTNPRVIPLPPGLYDVSVGAIGIQGENRRMFEAIEIVSDETVEHFLDFSSGELAIHATKNGVLSVAGIRIYTAGTNTQVAAGQATTSTGANPHIFTLAPGRYDVLISPRGVAGTEPERRRGISVEPGGRAEIEHAVSSGMLRVGVTFNGGLVDATIRIHRVEDNREVDRNRTYTSERSNPSTFELLPGRYIVRVRGVRMEGDPRREFEVAVTAENVVERSVDLSGD